MRKSLRDKRTPKYFFYVYALTGASGRILYVGKGTNGRLNIQKLKYGLSGHEIVRFKYEKDAFDFEEYLIKEIDPILNISTGRTGRRALFGPTPATELVANYSMA